MALTTRSNASSTPVAPVPVRGRRRSRQHQLWSALSTSNRREGVPVGRLNPVLHRSVRSPHGCPHPRPGVLHRLLHSGDNHTRVTHRSIPSCGQLGGGVWRTRRWAQDLPDLVLVGTPSNAGLLWGGVARAQPAPPRCRARRVPPSQPARLSSPPRNPHATATPHGATRCVSARHATARHGPACMAPEHGTERDGTERRAEASLGTARHGTGRDGTGQRDSAGLARCGTPIPTQDGTAGLGTTRHTHPDTGRDRGSRHHTAHPPRDGRGGEGEPRHTQHGTGGDGEPRHHGTPSTAWRGITARHVTASAFGVRRSARHRSPRRINITHQRKNAPSRERRGVLVYPGVSRW